MTKRKKERKTKWITSSDAAQMLGVSKGLMRVWRSRGVGPDYYQAKKGCAVRYDLSVLQGYLKENGQEIAWRKEDYDRIHGGRKMNVYAQKLRARAISKGSSLSYLRIKESFGDFVSNPTVLTKILDLTREAYLEGWHDGRSELKEEKCQK
jgi:hypothetical protein